MRQTLDILSHDEEFNTIFARGVSGSVTLDIIPDAIAYLKSHPTFKQMYLQDFVGTAFVITQESTIESAIQAWEMAGDIRRGTYKPKTTSQPAPVQSEEAPIEPVFIL